MAESDDFYRYIESLQNQLHTPDWDDFYDISKMKKWFTENSIKFDQNLGPQWERRVMNWQTWQARLFAFFFILPALWVAEFFLYCFKMPRAEGN